MKKLQQKGLTLIESLFVLGILAIIIGLVMVLLSINDTRARDNKFNSEMIQLVKSLDDMIQESKDTAPTAPELIAYADIPNEYVKDSSLVTPFGSAISLGDTTYGYGLTTASLYKVTCLSIVTGWNDLNTITVNGTHSTTFSTMRDACTSASTIVFLAPSSIKNTTNSSSSSGSDSSSSGDSSSGSGSDDSTSDPLTPAETNLAQLMQEQMTTAATAKANYKAASAAADAAQAQAQADAAAGNYDAMNQAYNTMNQQRNAMNQALSDWNKALDLGNQINAATQQIYAGNGQNQTETTAAVSAAAKSVNYSDPTKSGITG